jgi:hypothetical protein
MQHYDVGDFHHTYAECARKHYGMGWDYLRQHPELLE